MHQYVGKVCKRVQVNGNVHYVLVKSAWRRESVIKVFYDVEFEILCIEDKGEWRVPKKTHGLLGILWKDDAPVGLELLSPVDVAKLRFRGYYPDT